MMAAQLLLGGCAEVPTARTSTAAIATSPAASEPPRAAVITPTQGAVISPSPSATERLLPPSTTEESPAQVCSPLEGFALDALRSPDLLKELMVTPRPGMDDGHHGIDLAFWTLGERETMQGLPVYSVLAGRVAGVILNRLPYGNAVIVETPLESLAQEVAAQLAVPAPQPTVASPVLTCPADPRIYGDPSKQSLYLLYAHLDTSPALAVGDAVGCGDSIGQVGTTGKSINYHLHLEARVGPAGSTFPSFAHYDTAATAEEMAAYCTWRVSGLFQLIDPLVFFPEPAAAPSLQP
jgi:murein DD-endopeptidase MepM/ murein hydrolase activator NlpD